MDVLNGELSASLCPSRIYLLNLKITESAPVYEIVIIFKLDFIALHSCLFLKTI